MTAEIIGSWEMGDACSGSEIQTVSRNSPWYPCYSGFLIDGRYTFPAIYYPERIGIL